MPHPRARQPLRRMLDTTNWQYRRLLQTTTELSLPQHALFRVSVCESSPVESIQPVAKVKPRVLGERCCSTWIKVVYWLCNSADLFSVTVLESGNLNQEACASWDHKRLLCPPCSPSLWNWSHAYVNFVMTNIIHSNIQYRDLWYLRRMFFKLCNLKKDWCLFLSISGYCFTKSQPNLKRSFDITGSRFSTTQDPWAHSNR